MYNILDLDIYELKNWMEENGESKFRAKQVMEWIYKKNIWDFEHMNNLPKSTKKKLSESFYIDIPKIVNMYTSKARDTFKFLYEFMDGNVIECVVMKYRHGNSICVSTQVGCRMGCRFCASTLGGMVRNLSTGEILAQILEAQNKIQDRISNVVLMGSGEPLDNYENVIKFLDMVNSDYTFNIGQRHVTLSTCGLIPRILELAEKNYQITLAISLHAPNDELRKTTMPIANKYSIAEIIDACKYYIKKTNRRVSFEYALIKDVNDMDECAYELSKLLKGILCHVNLIPVNKVKEKKYEKSSSSNVKRFYNILTKSGIETTIRREMGSDINAACGQLRRSYLKSKNDLEGV
ncbi:23S rRNA (adenine(2503)-C(2))-methyltransferase RlmN [Clostridium sp. JN-1]|uniref:23S rRNA (adenine(2503)-C(2))-methyltransferase RlmN n=1 Tax=Clostridium sp. JN-1 TaxID=2483110 RepID=UPI000F0B271F|nr:23S rRNA (adenine(2503)-C(2))-methyltransferase RlmN [Clostridium sp. JN-1]